MTGRRERRERPPAGAGPGTPKIHGYAVQSVIGRGGAAVVYLARERKHGRLVALKVLRPDLSASLHAERFLREIEIVAALSHPNILPLLDSGRTSELLYYVTPYVSGESLRARLTRERQLSVRESVGVVREVAEALDYAHRRGVVHRDIKPENILLEDGHAVVADFGIARALSVAGEQHITAQGLVIGTAAYMSPEQASGEAQVDGRSDIYSLGCVLFELLSGGTPFTGTTPVQFVAQHLAAPVPSLRALRPTITPALEEALATALAKVPADRYATARQFSEALAEVTTGSHHRFEAARPRRRLPNARRAAAAAVAVAVVGGGAWAASRVVASRGADRRDSARFAATSPADAGLDTTRFVVLPADSAAGGAATAPADVSERLANALERWTGLTVVDGLQLRDTLLAARRAGRPSPAPSDDPRAVALALGAGRYVRAQTVGGSGDSLTVRATLYDTRRNARLSDATARVATDPARGDPAMAQLASDLLFPDRPPDAAAEPTAGTRSYPARDAYLRAHAAVARWDLAAADSLFLAATVHDPHYARAFLWLAQVRSWRREQPDPRWRFAAEQAYAERSTLAPREALLADALRALAGGETVRACALWTRLTTLAPSDYTAWYGLGTCRRSDDVVVRDARSPSGWRFRTSYRQALAAYRRAFQLFPSLHRSSRGGSFDDVQEILFTSSGAARRGFALAPDTLRFLAYPSWEGDTLAFTPYPESEFASGRAVTHSEAVNAAIRQQRKQFYDIATTWRSAFPESPDAVEAVAISLDLLGNGSAMDTLRLARRMAVDEAARLHMATIETLMRVKFAAPSDVAGLREAQRLADSVLGAHRPADRAEARQMASLAALLGRANLAAAYTRIGESQNAPAAIAQTAPALLAFAALGGPVDSLAALESSVARVVESSMTGSDQEMARAGWLLRAAYLAVPERRFTSIPREYRGESVGTKLLVAWRDGDLPAARATLQELGVRRRSASIRAFDVTPDALYPEAAVLASLGDDRGAVQWLDPTLDSLSLVDPQALADVARAGTLVRAMALRARLAERAGDHASTRAWAGAAAALWSKPDPFLAPTVRRLQEMAASR